MPARRAVLASAPAVLAGFAGCGLLDTGPSYPSGTVVFENRDDREHRLVLLAERDGDGERLGDRHSLAPDAAAVAERLLGEGEWDVTVEMDGEDAAAATVSFPRRGGDGPHLLVRVGDDGDVVVRREG